MDRTTLAKAASPILLVTAFVVGGLAAGSVPYQEGSPPVREFFERLVERSGTSRPPTPDEVGKIGDRIDSAAREEISDALPAIFAAAGHNDPTVKGFAVLAL